MEILVPTTPIEEYMNFIEVAIGSLRASEILRFPCVLKDAFRD